MSPLEIVMMICFGVAWPFSIVRSWKARSTTGKSGIFLWIILVGYLAGIGHKILYNYNGVIFFYLLNTLLVSTDIAIFHRNRWLMSRAGNLAAADLKQGDGSGNRGVQ